MPNVYRVAFVGFLIGLAAPFVVPIALLFAKWDTAATVGTWGGYAVPRGDLPHWARMWSTPDERLPGSTAEPSVWACYQRFGPFITAWYWLGIRNRANGWEFFRYARELLQPWPPEPGYFTDPMTGMWWVRKPIFGGRFVYKAGWRSYRVDNKWWGVPCWTITKP